VWLSEQRRIVSGLKLDEAATRSWVRKFVVPALRPPSVVGPSRAELQAACADLGERLRVLDATLTAARAAIDR
jgi:hypothetical protein